MKTFVSVGRRLVLAGAMFGVCLAGVARASEHKPVAPNRHDSAETLLETDRAIAAQSRTRGFVPAYSKAMGADPRKLDAGELPVIGRAAVSALLAKYPAALAVDWTPREAVVADSGELGLTWGTYVATLGKKHLYGKYLDVWHRDRDGRWRWIADIGNDSPPPAKVRSRGEPPRSEN